MATLRVRQRERLASIQSTVVLVTSLEEGPVLYILLVIFVLVSGSMAVLIVENFAAFSTGMQLSFFGLPLPPIPLGLLLLISCLLGAALLYTVTVVSALQERRELQALRQRVAELEQAQARMPAFPQQLSPSLIVPMPGITGPLPPVPPYPSQQT